MRVTEIAVEDTWALRGDVLRGGDRRPAAVRFAEDDRPGTFHIGARSDGEDVVAVATLIPIGAPDVPAASPWQLRGMAVRPDLQGTGTGRMILDAAIAAVLTRGGDVLWANARDSALGFYLGAGMQVVGEGFVVASLGLPHHRVVLHLGRPHA